MISILRKGFLLMVFLLFLMLLGTLIFGGDRLFGHALKKYGPVAFGQPVAFEKAELSVLGGSAGIEQFHVGTAEYPLLDIGKAEVNIGTMELLDGRVRIENAQLDGTLLHLIVKEDGTLAFDKGPPPPEVTDGNPMPPEEKPLPPADKRDIVQIATEYWERYQHYKEYYDKVGGFGGDDETEEEALARVAHPGVPDYVTTAMQLAEGASEGVFWLENAEVKDFAWKTTDLRKGKPILPEIKDFHFQLQNVGTPPAGVAPQAVYAGKGALVDGGAIDFRLGLSRDGSNSSLDFTAEGLKVSSIARMANKSFPFHIKGGTVDFGTSELSFNPNSLSGGVRVVLNNTTLTPKNSSPNVLGVAPNEFCTLLNSALQDQPIAFMIRLGGTPSNPTFDIENETDLGDLLGGAVKAEVERRAQELIDEQSGKLLDKAADLIDDKLGDKLPDGVGDQLKEGLGGALDGGLDVGGLLGGSKKDKKKKKDD